jgi:hypothetical protein
MTLTTAQADNLEAILKLLNQLKEIYSQPEKNNESVKIIAAQQVVIISRLIIVGLSDAYIDGIISKEVEIQAGCAINQAFMKSDLWQKS